MVGALSVMGSSVVDPHTSPCLCLDSLPTTNIGLKNSGDLALQRSSIKRKQLTRPGSLELGSSFVDSWHDWRLSSKAISGIVSKSSRKQRKERGLVIVSELAGQYEDSFEDVKAVSFYCCLMHLLALYLLAPPPPPPLFWPVDDETQMSIIMNSCLCSKYAAVTMS